MNKKIIAILLATVLLLSLAACGGAAGNGEQNPGKDPVQQGGSAGGNATGETGSAQGGEGGSDVTPTLDEITVAALESYPTTDAGEFQYDISSSGEGFNIYAYTGSNPIVVVPATIDGKPVEEIAAYTFGNESTVRAVVVPESVTLLKEVFINNVHLEMVIAKGAVEVGYGAFCNCPKLTTVVLGEGVTTIGDSAFFSCAALTELHIPEAMTEMSPDAQATAFLFCDSLKIYGKSGSFIEQICTAQSIPFVAE